MLTLGAATGGAAADLLAGWSITSTPGGLVLPQAVATLNQHKEQQLGQCQSYTAAAYQVIRCCHWRHSIASSGVGPLT
jgi:hypothetical protein